MLKTCDLIVLVGHIHANAAIINAIDSTDKPSALIVDATTTRTAKAGIVKTISLRLRIIVS